MHGDLFYQILERGAAEAVEKARPCPVDGPEFAYWTGRSSAFTEAAAQYKAMGRRMQTGRD